VVATPASPPVVPLPEQVRVDVLVLPQTIAEDGTAVYHESVLTLVKELRALDTDAAYQHEAEDRGWYGERSVSAIVLSLIVGVASAAGWDGLRALLSGDRHRSERVHAKIARCTSTDDGVTWEWFEVEGPGAEVANALEAIQPGGTGKRAG